MKSDETEDEKRGADKLSDLAGEAIAEVLSEIRIEIEPEERVVLAEQLIERFTSI